MTDVRIPEKDQQAVAQAIVLLRKAQKLKGGDGGAIEKLWIGMKVKEIDPTIRSLAEARMRGEDRPGLRDAMANPGNRDEIAREWAKTLDEHKDLTVRWNQTAVDSELQFQTSVEAYVERLEELIDPLKAAKSSNIPKVKGRAEDALKSLEQARKSLDTLGKASGKAAKELVNFNQLVEYLKGDPPQTLAEVKGTRASFAEAIQAVRRSELAIRHQVEAVNELSSESEATLESTIKAMVVAAIAWRQSKGTREGTEWLESLLNGAVAVVQVAAGEPLTGTAVQGMHMLIKGVCDGIKGFAAWLESTDLKKNEVMDLLDKLEADDFIQAKLDAIKMGLSWAAEPLGFIPSVGSLVRAAINAAVGQVIGTLKEAAEKQKKAKGQLKASSFEKEIEEIGSTIKEIVIETVKGGLESGAEAYDAIKDYSEFVKQGKSPAEMILSACMALFGPPLKKLLADVVPSFKMVDKDSVKQTLQGARDAVHGMTTELEKMKAIKVDFAFDEDNALQLNIAALKALKKVGQTSDVLVVGSPEVGSRGVALLLGSGHESNNYKFVTTLLDGGHGCKGLVTLTKLPSGPFSGVIKFTLQDPKGKELVESYLAHHKSTGKPLTKHDVKFA